jgi:hypothetical protein
MIKSLVTLGVASFASYTSTGSVSTELEAKDIKPRLGVCILDPQPRQVAKGIVKFEQANEYSKTHITGKFTGL